jgi:hypothetical protein
MSPTGRAAASLALALLAACGGAGSDTTVPSAAACPEADAADSSMITVERAAMLIGLSEAEAERCAAELGWGWRVGERDGEIYAVTADWSPSRVTVTVVDGTVTAVVAG